MPEIHTVDFRRGSINIISNAERATITLQFAGDRDAVESVDRILKAIRRRYGDGLINRLSRWRTGEGSSFVLPLHSRPHPESPDILCFEIGVNRGGGLESALATLLEFLRQQPGYEHTFGAPLDRDQMPSPGHKVPPSVASEAAQDVLEQMMKQRRR
jgi:hypothetical protein